MAASTESRPLEYLTFYLQSVQDTNTFFLVTIVQFDLRPLNCQRCVLNIISIDCKGLEVCLDVGEKKYGRDYKLADDPCHVSVKHH